MAVDALTTEELLKLWRSGDAARTDMDKRGNYYNGNHAIVGQNKTYADGNKASELVSNWPRYIVNRYVGSMTKTPFQVTLDPTTDADSAVPDEEQAEGVVEPIIETGPRITNAIEQYSDVAKDQNLEAADGTNLRNSLIYGYGTEVHSFDTERIIITTTDPREWMFVRDSADNLCFAVRQVMLPAWSVYRGEYLTEPKTLMTVYSDQDITVYERRLDSGGKEELVKQEGSPEKHFYDAVPVVQWRTNEMLESLISNAIISQVDEWNTIDSMSGDDIRQTVDAVLKMMGVDPDWINKNAKMILEKRMLPMPENSSAEYLEKKTDTAPTENHLERTRQMIHMMGEVPDVGSIVGASGATSGIALKLMFTPMEEGVAGMVPFLKSGMRDRIDLMNAMLIKLSKPIIENYNIIIQFVIPVNQIEQWKSIGMLNGIVSHRTQLEILQDVDDPERELAALRDEALRQNIVIDVEDEDAVAFATEARVVEQAKDLQPKVGELVEALAASVQDFMLTSGTLERVVDRRRAAAVQEGAT